MTKSKRQTLSADKCHVGRVCLFSHIRLKKLITVLPLSILLFLILAFPAIAQNKKAKVVFISVATETEVFWGGIHALATAAAKDLGVDLEILYSDRNHLAAVAIAKKVSQRKNKPDYAIVVGESLIASKSIPILTASGIKVFMYGSLTAVEKKVIGEPREKYPAYLGKIAIDDYMAGYLTAEIMAKEAIRLQLHDQSGLINFLAFEGVRRTSFSSERVRGLNDVLKKYPSIRVLQSVPTDWSYENASRVLPGLLKRYSTYKIAGVWCANTNLSRASADILKSQGKTPGFDFVTAGTDWDNKSIKAVNSGDILGLAGGHVASAAWIITLIHDYHNGIDFDSNIFYNKVTIMDKESSGKFLKYFATGDWDIIDFTRHSKIENPHLEEYDFSFGAIFDDL